MATVVPIKHSSGLVKNGVYGFSWTYLFFGPFVPLFRGEILTALLHFFLNAITFGISYIIFCFIYNRQYMNRMFIDGWVLAGTEFQNSEAKNALNLAD